MIARIAGYGYLIIFLSGFFANFFVLENLFVADNASATMKNILANETIFRFGILSFIIMVIFDLVVAWALYLFLKPINKYLSLLAAWFRLVNCAIFGAALFNLISGLNIATEVEYLTAIEISIHEAQIMILLNAFNYTWLIGLIFFGIHLFFIGYIIVRSVNIPKWLGILLIIASTGYLIDSFANLLLPVYDNYKQIFQMIVFVPGVIGEFSFCVWLIFKGSKIPESKFGVIIESC